MTAWTTVDSISNARPIRHLSRLTIRTSSPSSQSPFQACPKRQQLSPGTNEQLLAANEATETAVNKDAEEVMDIAEAALLKCVYKETAVVKMAEAVQRNLEVQTDPLTTCRGSGRSPTCQHFPDTQCRCVRTCPLLDRHWRSISLTHYPLDFLLFYSSTVEIALHLHLGWFGARLKLLNGLNSLPPRRRPTLISI